MVLASRRPETLQVIWEPGFESVQSRTLSAGPPGWRSASALAKWHGRAGGGQPGPRWLCAVPEAWARGVCGAGRTSARGGRQAREGRRSSAPARPPHGPAAPGPPGARAARPALLVPGVRLLRAVRLCPPAQTFVEHRQGTGADLPPGGPGTPARVPQRPLSGYPLLRADQGEGRRAPGARGGSLTRARAVGAASSKGAGLTLPKCFPATGTLRGGGGTPGKTGGTGLGVVQGLNLCLSAFSLSRVWGGGGRETISMWNFSNRRILLLPKQLRKFYPHFLLQGDAVSCHPFCLLGLRSAAEQRSWRCPAVLGLSRFFEMERTDSFLESHF